MLIATNRSNLLKFKHIVMLLFMLGGKTWITHLNVVHMRSLLFIYLMLIPISLSVNLTVQLEKPTHCDIKVSNTTDKNVAFKVKTTSPKKYFVRPNTGVIQPWDTCIIRVTLQAQHEYPPDKQCKDKFLLQSTPVPPHTDIDDLPQNTFTKESGKTLEECKLKVFYVARTDQGNSDDSLKHNSDPSSNQAVQTARAARDAAVREAAQLQQELDMLKRRNQRKGPGFSLRLAIVAGLIGLMVGFLLKLVLSSPPTPTPTAATATAAAAE